MALKILEISTCCNICKFMVAFKAKKKIQKWENILEQNKTSIFFQNEVYLISEIDDGTEPPMHESDSVTVPCKHRKHSSVMVNVPDI